MATKWGFAGCGFIGSDFANAMLALPKEEHVIYAAASRDLSKAQKFVTKFGGKKAYDSYEKLANDPEIDVIYVNVINTKHNEIVMMCLNAGKNVLCEKPIGVNLKQVRQMVALARRKRVFFMEAVWSRCCPVYRECLKRLQSNDIGEVEHVIGTFGFLLENDRVLKKSLGGSATLDIGVYLIQFALFAFGGQKPEKIVATGILNEEEVDRVMSVTLTFPKGKIATLTCNANCTLPNEAFICGSKGTIKVDFPFWLPETLTSPSGTFTAKLPSIPGATFNYGNSQGLMYEAQEVRECLKRGELESSKIPLDETLLMGEILEEILLQMGVDYSNE